MTVRFYLLYDPKTTFKSRLDIAWNYALMLPDIYMRNHYVRHHIALPKYVNHVWYMLLYDSHDKHKQISKQTNKQ